MSRKVTFALVLGSLACLCLCGLLVFPVLNRLQPVDYDACEADIARLEQQGADGINGLEKYISGSPDWRVRIAAAEALGRIGRQSSDKQTRLRVIKILVARLEDRSDALDLWLDTDGIFSGYQSVLHVVIVEMGPEAIPDLIVVAEQGNCEARVLAIAILTNILADQSVEPAVKARVISVFEQATSDPSPYVRRVAKEALEAFEAEEVRLRKLGPFARRADIEPTYRALGKYIVRTFTSGMPRREVLSKLDQLAPYKIEKIAERRDMYQELVFFCEQKDCVGPYLEVVLEFTYSSEDILLHVLRYRP